MQNMSSGRLNDLLERRINMATTDIDPVITVNSDVPQVR